MKIKIIGKQAQASVEYMLMIALVAGIVLSLTKFSGLIESKLISWKLGARNQLAGLDQSSSGTYDIDKGMFKQTNIALNSSSSAGRGQGGAGGRGSAKGSSTGPRDGKTGSGEEEEGSGLKDVDVNASQGKKEADQDATNYGSSTRRGDYGDTSDLESTRRPTEDDYLSTRTDTYAGTGKTDQTDDKKNSVEEEKETSKSSLIKKRQGEEVQAKDRTLAEKDWSIGKFLIILLLLLFFIVIVLKAKQARD